MQESKTTEIITGDDKGNINSKFQIIKTTWKNIPSPYRKFIIGYGIIVFTSYISYNYNDGRKALIDYRIKNSNTTSQKEWTAIKDGINSFSNFWEAIFFPFSISEKIMPTVILYLNPK